jgi:O-antigen/teichoic acid export membrane protein
MVGDTALVAVSLTIAAFMGLLAFRDIRRGELSMNRFASPVTRAESPGVFWFVTGLSLAMAALCLAMGIGAAGNVAGWWEIGS